MILFLILFADDIMLLIDVYSYNTIITMLNNELIKIVILLQANNLTINTNKTHYMIVHQARLKPTVHVEVINIKSHNVTNKIRNLQVHYIKKARNNLNKTLLLRVIKLVFPIFPHISLLYR